MRETWSYTLETDRTDGDGAAATTRLPSPSTRAWYRGLKVLLEWRLGSWEYLPFTVLYHYDLNSDRGISPFALPKKVLSLLAYGSGRTWLASTTRASMCLDGAWEKWIRWLYFGMMLTDTHEYEAPDAENFNTYLWKKMVMMTILLDYAWFLMEQQSCNVMSLSHWRWFLQLILSQLFNNHAQKFCVLLALVISMYVCGKTGL